MEKSLPIEIVRFKKIREEKGYTQQAFAELLGIKSSTADIERGKTKITGQVVMKLLEEFGINPLWLFGKSFVQYVNLNQVDVSPKVVAVDANGGFLFGQLALGAKPNSKKVWKQRSSCW